MSQDIRSRISESGIDFALNAFWVSVTGAIVTAAFYAVALWRGLPVQWLWAIVASFLTFVFVIVSTVSIVRIARSRKVRPIGRRGLLDFVRDRDRGIALINQNVGVLSNYTVRIGVKAARHGRLFESAKRRGWTWLADLRARNAARDLEREGLRMGIYAQRFSDSVDMFTVNTKNWLDWMQQDGSPVQQDTFVPIIESFRKAVAGALPNIKGFRTASDKNRRLSAELDVGSGRIVSALDQVIDGMQRTIDFCNTILGEPVISKPGEPS